jgi:excisionase family DNA binding protein
MHADTDHVDTPQAVEPATYSAPELARRLGVSERHVHRLRDAGTLPTPIRLGRLIRWNRAVIEEWIRDGCPSQRRA